MASGAAGTTRSLCGAACATTAGRSWLFSHDGVRSNAPAVPTTAIPAPTSAALKGFSFMTISSNQIGRGRFRLTPKIGTSR